MRVVTATCHKFIEVICLFALVHWQHQLSLLPGNACTMLASTPSSALVKYTEGSGEGCMSSSAMSVCCCGVYAALQHCIWVSASAVAVADKMAQAVA